MESRTRRLVLRFRQEIDAKHLEQHVQSFVEQPKSCDLGAVTGLASIIHVYKATNATLVPLGLHEVDVLTDCCYVVLHTYGGIVGSPQTPTPAIAAITRFALNATTGCLDRSLARPVSSGLSHDMYLWVGRRSSASTKATASALVAKLGSAFSAIDAEGHASVHSIVLSLCLQLSPFGVSVGARALGTAQQLKLFNQVHLLRSLNSLPSQHTNHNFAISGCNPRGGEVSSEKSVPSSINTNSNTHTNTATTTTTTLALSPQPPHHHHHHHRPRSEHTRPASRRSLGKSDLTVSTIVPKPVSPTPPPRPRVHSDSSTDNIAPPPKSRKPAQRRASAAPTTKPRPPATAYAPPRHSQSTTYSLPTVKERTAGDKSASESDNSPGRRKSFVPRLSDPRNSLEDSSPEKDAKSPRSPNLELLHLKNYGKSNSFISERSVRQVRKQQLAESSGKCDEITPAIFLAGDEVARSKELLKGVGITSILNVAAPYCKNYHPDDFTYKAVHLSDNSTCDIESTFYDMVEFIREGTANGKVLVHCFQGVSRSASAVIVFLMVENKRTYEEALNIVTAKRPVAKPNPFFMHQLVTLQARLQKGVTTPRLYEISPQSETDPSYLVARAVRNPNTVPSMAFKSVSSVSFVFDTCFVLQCPEGKVFLWLGSGCSKAQQLCAQKHIARLQKHEHATQVVTINQGGETPEFWSHFEDKGELFAPNSQSQKQRLTTSLVINIVPDENDTNNDENVVANHCKAKKGNPSNDPSRQSEMWEWPVCEDLGLFDTDDLVGEGVFIVFDRTNLLARGGVFVWIGSESVLWGKPKREMVEAALTVLRQAGIPPQSVGRGHIHVVLQGEEADQADFWSMFQNG